jgi:formylglycine-generating enzyme required for sulfatase activity
MNSLLQRLPRGLKRQTFIRDFRLLASVFVKNSAVREAEPMVFEEFRETSGGANAGKQTTGRSPRPGAFENTLGMRFVPVQVGAETVHFSIWETRVQDYQAYANSTSGVDGSWRNPVFGRQAVTPVQTCPVVNVSWSSAQKFAAWLTEKERREGRIPASARYRLPTDTEWSWAVGIGDRESSGSPKQKDGQLRDFHPWGLQFPPSARAGNYADRAAKSAFSNWTVIEGYEDGHVTTAPVGSFPASDSGLHDLGGNVWEWCEDFYDGQSGAHVLRGGAWNRIGRDDLLSSYRRSSGDTRLDDVGFRLVLVGVPVR